MTFGEEAAGHVETDKARAACDKNSHPTPGDEKKLAAQRLAC